MMCAWRRFSHGASELGEFFQTVEWKYSDTGQLLGSSGVFNVARRALRLLNAPSRLQQVTLNRSCVLATDQMQTDTSARRASNRERARRLLSAFVLAESVFFFLPDPETLIATTRSAVCVCPRLHASHTPAGIMYRFWVAVRWRPREVAPNINCHETGAVKVPGTITTLPL